jgi:orotidine-5'-phosphate decarboxylase
MTGLLVALDVPDLDRAVEMARRVRPHVTGYKLGLQLLLGPAPHSIERLTELDKPLFVDAKLHDIPATVERAAYQLGKRGARWVTVHAGGGAEMLRAGVSGLREGSAGTAGVLGVTVLTSLGASDLDDLGIAGDLQSHTQRLVALSASADCEGVICSVHEVGLVQQVSSLITVTPGIRPESSLRDDQKRVATPGMARRVGSTYVVVGRPITTARDVASAAEAIRRELSNPIAAAPTDSDG